METTTETKVLLVSRLANNTQGNGENYIVERCDDPRCVYKVFKDDTGDFHIMLYTSQWNRYHNYSRSYESHGLVMSEEETSNKDKYKGKPLERVHLIVDIAHTVSLEKQRNAHTPNLVLCGHTFELSWEFCKDGRLSKIVEHGGLFFVDLMGVLATARQLLDTGNTSAIRTIKELREYNDMEVLDRLYEDIAPNQWDSLGKAEGITKTLKSVIGFYHDLKGRSALRATAFAKAANGSKKVVSGVKFSVAFNKLFEGVDTQDKFDALVETMLTQLMEAGTWDESDYLVKLLDTLPEARDIKKAAIKRRSTGAFNKIMDDLDFVKVDPAKHPLTHEAIHSGDLPLGTFFRKSGESYFLYNDNWGLWEEMLSLHRETAMELAAEASKRTQYEKDLMSYFYFTLHALPEYLEEHTGEKWTGVPRLVQSSEDLDPPKEGDNGVAKTRSALTPVADNATHTVAVPYVSMQLSGYSTTYTYGLNYCLLRRGFSLDGNVVTEDVERALNGRDDYGLMFYTLTGSAQGRGYPTFLVIFERLDGGRTEVHFHRTHPMRSKNGDYNPVHNWVSGCYRWMVGNVNFERIAAQQGDLAFVSVDSVPPGEVRTVDSYDSHRFARGVGFVDYARKDGQNVLGYAVVDEDTTLNHVHHAERLIPAGLYEIRQCRSWEANPKGVWSLRID